MPTDACDLERLRGERTQGLLHLSAALARSEQREPSKTSEPHRQTGQHEAHIPFCDIGQAHVCLPL